MMNNKYTIHRLQVDEPIVLSLSSRDYYSKSRLEVKHNEQYTFKVDTTGPRWWDMVIPTYGEGWDAIFVSDRWKRLTEKPLFYLCGCINEDDPLTFAIGNNLENWQPRQNGNLSFFANDYPAMYFNNWGRIKLKIIRTK